MQNIEPTFSVRNRGRKNWIDGAFPVTARNGLLHILSAGVEKDYLKGWPVVAKELRRISRLAPSNYDNSSVSSIQRARVESETYLNQLDWDKLYDFCERLHNHLTETITYSYNEEAYTTTKAQAQSFFAEEIQRLFEEEGLAYAFRDGVVQRRGKQHTSSQAKKAEVVLADQKLNAAREHFSKALRYFHDRKQIDHENTVKEAICAVEAAAKALFPGAKAQTLGDFVNWAANNERLFPKTIGQTLSGLYGFRGSGVGVSHGGASGGRVTSALSEYILGMTASQIIFLTDLARNDDGPPS